MERTANTHTHAYFVKEERGREVEESSKEVQPTKVDEEEGEDGMVIVSLPLSLSHTHTLHTHLWFPCPIRAIQPRPLGE